MTGRDRRSFLKQAAWAVAAAHTSACERRAADAPSVPLDPQQLRALAEAVLPEELRPDGIEAAVRAFERWLAEYDPVPELNHGYGTSEIRYGPGDPAPGWRAQLAALDLESERRLGARFEALAVEARRDLLRRHLSGSAAASMPSPLRAEHVSVALMGHYFSSPGATDLCYGARIGARTCRGIDTAPARPDSLEAEP